MFSECMHRKVNNNNRKFNKHMSLSRFERRGRRKDVDIDRDGKAEDFGSHPQMIWKWKNTPKGMCNVCSREHFNVIMRLARGEIFAKEIDLYSASHVTLKVIPTFFIMAVGQSWITERGTCVLTSLK